MPASRPAKKTGSVEVRLSDEMKAAFAERCRREDVTVSEAVRRLMEAQLNTPTGRARGSRSRMIAAGLLGVALGAGAAAPSFAQAGVASRPAFEVLDRDHDGILTPAEYRR
jgi:predicted component of type VI protein secretion system